MTPLEDPRYIPLHPPVNGMIPDVIERWGPSSQIRWFTRFRQDLKLWRVDLTSYWISSLEHRGACCGTCLGELEETGIDPMDGYCCCCLGDFDEGLRRAREGV